MATTSLKKDKGLEEFEERNQWWWLAEKGRSKRLDYLRKAVWKKGAIGGIYPPGIKIDLTFPQLFTEAWKENEGGPIMLRKARAFAHALDKTPIFITDHAQMVGDANVFGVWDSVRESLCPSGANCCGKF